MSNVKLFKIQRAKQYGEDEWPAVYVLSTSVGAAVDGFLAELPDKDAPVTIHQLAETPVLRVTAEVGLGEIQP